MKKNTKQLNKTIKNIEKRLKKYEAEYNKEKKDRINEPFPPMSWLQLVSTKLEAWLLKHYNSTHTKVITRYHQDELFHILIESWQYMYERGWKSAAIKLPNANTYIIISKSGQLYVTSKKPKNTNSVQFETLRRRSKDALKMSRKVIRTLYRKS